MCLQDASELTRERASPDIDDQFSSAGETAFLLDNIRLGRRPNDSFPRRFRQKQWSAIDRFQASGPKPSSDFT